MLRRLLSVPIYIKILGIGFVVTALFGLATFYQLRVGVYQTQYRILGESAAFIASSLSARLGALADARDPGALDQEIRRTAQVFPHIRYVIVQDDSGEILAHAFTFPAEVPDDLLQRKDDLCATCHLPQTPINVPLSTLEGPLQGLLREGGLRAYSRSEGIVVDATATAAHPAGVTVRVGIGDKAVKRELAEITGSLMWTLVLCAVVGQGLALWLAYLLVKPVRSLVGMAARIREGDFSARAEVYSNDEIGVLAMAFNEMAAGIARYREQVQEKEAARVSLIGSIVQAQEEERKRLARELHDQLGQSLSNALLTVESNCRDCGFRHERCDAVKSHIRDTIDEVRRLAWDARPSILDDYGLDRALARYAEEMSQRLRIPVDYQYVGPKHAQRLPDRVEVPLYRIAQEAMTNVARHAEAREASIVLLRHDSEVSLIVEDNGKGFDVAALGPSPDAALGLLGMQERAAQVGGTVDIDTRPGGGTTVRVRVRLEQTDNAYSDTHR